MGDVLLTVTGTSFIDGSDGDKMEIITGGKMYQKGNAVFLVYRESELSGLEGCTTTLRIQDESIVMMRYNSSQVLNTKIEFQKDRLYNGYYSTPCGMIEMNIRTDSIENRITPEQGGSLKIDYHMELVGLSEGRNILEIDVRKGAQDE